MPKSAIVRLNTRYFRQIESMLCPAKGQSATLVLRRLGRPLKRGTGAVGLLFVLSTVRNGRVHGARHRAKEWLAQPCND